MLRARMHLAALKSLRSIRARMFALPNHRTCVSWLIIALGFFEAASNRTFAGPLVSSGSLHPGSETGMTEKMESTLLKAEGVVTFIHRQANGLEMELKTGGSALQIQITDASGISPALLLNSRLRCRGTGEIAWTLEGQKVAGILRVANRRDIEILEAAPKLWDNHPPISIGELMTNFNDAEETLLRVIGRVISSGPGQVLTLGDESSAIQIETLQTNSWPVSSHAPRRNQRRNGCAGRQPSSSSSSRSAQAS